MIRHYCPQPNTHHDNYKCGSPMRSIYTREHQHWVHVGWYCKQCGYTDAEPSFAPRRPTWVYPPLPPPFPAPPH